MAKTEKPNTPPSAPTAGNAALAVVTPAEASIAGTSSIGSAALASLEQALNGKGNFEKPEEDFWNPKEGDTLIGAYLGSEKVGRLLQHGFAVKGKDGTLRQKRMNGSHIVTRVLSECRIGRVVKITYKGKTKTGTDGRELNQFDIALMAE